MTDSSSRGSGPSGLVIKRVNHGGHQILRVDCSQVPPDEFSEAADAVQRVITAAPPHSLRVLVILTGRVKAEAAEKLKRSMGGNGPYVLATAVVGTAFWKVAVLAVRAAGRDNVELFPNEAAALAWLVAQ